MYYFLKLKFMKQVCRIFFGIAFLVMMAIVVCNFVFSSESSFSDLKLANTEVLASGEQKYPKFCWMGDPFLVDTVDEYDFYLNPWKYPNYRGDERYCGDCDFHIVCITMQYECLD